MANKSNWKGSESKAAQLFPGAKRRLRTMGDWGIVADDVVWGPEHMEYTQPTTTTAKETRVVKEWGVYIEVKKRSKSFLTNLFYEMKEKYARLKGNALVLVVHLKGNRQQLVIVEGDFFKELIEAWAAKKKLRS